MAEQEQPGEMPTETPASEMPQAAPQAQSLESLQAELKQARDALKSANAESAKRRKELEGYQAKEKATKDAELSEVEKLRQALAEIEGKNKILERKQNQRAAAEKAGLPAAFADRLQGETPEELEADAKILLEALPKQKAPSLNPTNPGGGQNGETLEQQRARIYGAANNPFDIKVAQSKGGGVFFVDNGK